MVHCFCYFVCKKEESSPLFSISRSLLRNFLREKWKQKTTRCGVLGVTKIPPTRSPSFPFQAPSCPTSPKLNPYVPANEKNEQYLRSKDQIKCSVLLNQVSPSNWHQHDRPIISSWFPQNIHAYFHFHLILQNGRSYPIRPKDPQYVNNSFLSSFANVGQAEESQHFPAGEGKTSIRVIKVDHALVLALDETKNQMIDGINHNKDCRRRSQQYLWI